MKAVILAAGRGSRMGELTQAQPKCMTEFAGRSLIHWQMASLRAAGVSEFGVVTGYLADRLRIDGAHRFHNPRWAETNMVRSLACASDWLRAQPCIVSYGDIFYDPEAVRRLAATAGELVITYDRDWLALWRARFDDPLPNAETFCFDAEGRLVAIGQRPRVLDEVQGQFMGLLKFTPSGWARVEALLERLTRPVCDGLDTTALLNRLIASGATVETVPVDGGWGEIDSQADLHVCEALRAEGAYPWMS